MRDYRLTAKLGQLLMNCTLAGTMKRLLPSIIALFLLADVTTARNDINLELQ
jgi:hypothetical protein